MAKPPLPELPAPPQLTYVDRPEISELFADVLARVSCEGNTARLEFVVNRMDDPRAGKPLTGKAVTAARIIIPLPGLIDMIKKLQKIMGQLENSGVVRQVHVHQGQGPQRPN